MAKLTLKMLTVILLDSHNYELEFPCLFCTFNIQRHDYDVFDDVHIFVFLWNGTFAQQITSLHSDTNDTFTVAQRICDVPLSTHHISSQLITNGPPTVVMHLRVPLKGASWRRESGHLPP